MTRIGLIGAGGMGRVHLRCYRENPAAKLVALCDVNAPALREARSIALRKDPANPDPLDLTGIAIHDQYEPLLADPDVDLVDICLPSPLHAPVTIAALNAGKHVFCEKPMAMTGDECRQMIQAWRRSGRHLSIGHSLRYMSQYTVAHEIIASGRLGRPIYGRFHRSGGLPVGSYNDWLRSAAQSGGVVLDLHIHDIDIAHWWFGREHTLAVHGIRHEGLPVQVDSAWRYDGGPLVHLHAGWDLSIHAPFRFAFLVQMERGSLRYDSALDTNAVRLFEAGQKPTTVPFADTSPNALQIADVLARIATGAPSSRANPDDAAAAVEVAERTGQAIA